MSVFVLGVLRWLQSVWVIQTSCCSTRKTSSCPAHFRIAVPVARNALHNSVFGCQRADCPSSFTLSSACSCAPTSCRSSSHCVSLLSESSNCGVKRKRASSEHSLSPRSATRCMSSRHRGQLSVAVEAVANSSRSDLVFTKALLSCVSWSSSDRSDNSTGSHIFDSAWRLSSQRPIYRLHSSTSRSARPGPRHHPNRTYATRPVPCWPPQPSLSTRWTTCEQSHQTHCNSLQLSLCHRREVMKRLINDLL